MNVPFSINIELPIDSGISFGNTLEESGSAGELADVDIVEALGADAVDAEAAEDADGSGLSPKEKFQAKVHCFESKGCLVKLSARDGRHFRDGRVQLLSLIHI